MVNKLFFFLSFFIVFHLTAKAQQTAGPIYVDSAKAIPSGPLSKAKLRAPEQEYKFYNPRNRGINKVVPGKGLPKTEDPVMQSKMGSIPTKAPSLSFDAASSRSTPTDPTGVVGPDYYLNAWNSAFSIFDKNGNQVVPPSSLASIGGEFSGESLGDPIVLYDEFADRYIISQFSDTPESFLIAISQGPDPINDGWYTYRFDTNGVLPDYAKISVWGDGYYITSNKNSETASESQVIYAVERDKMLNGEDARIVSFPLPGVRTNGFYSPAGFNGIGKIAPPRGNSPIVFMQDDAWAGVSEDILKIWLVNVDWNNLQNSTISESQELGASDGVSPFIATFDGGGFTNLSQPGEGTPDVDALQATMMYMTQYRRFSDHNSVVMNFVVDVDPSAAEHAGIRWYELRQNANGGPWRVYQEGTYAPDNSDRWSGSIGIDAQGNIGLGYTVLNDSPDNPVYFSIRYTGRFAGDEPGIMSLEEQSIVEGNSPNPSFRYGDYAHLSVDPADGLTFWHNAEYFEGVQRKNRVGVFRIASNTGNDIGVISLLSPQDASLGNSEEISVRVRNFGSNAQSGFPISYRVDSGQIVTETFTDNLPANSSSEFTFSQSVDFSEVGQTYSLNAYTSLNGDEQTANDTLVATVKNLPAKDIGVTAINAPATGQNLSNAEEISVSIGNFGGEPQQNFPVSYQIGNNIPVTETYSQTLQVGEENDFSFSQTANLSPSGRYKITSYTSLEDDFDISNDTTSRSVANLDCIPVGSDCSFGDGLSYFELGDILNERIPCTDGYGDFINFSTSLDRSQNNFSLTVRTFFDGEGDEEKFSMWIDLNDNAVFEDSERFITSEVLSAANTNFTFNFNLPEDAPLGQHLLRVRAGDTSFDGDLNNPCEVMEYGTTHDYSVNITDSTLSLEDFLLNEAELVVVTSPNENDQFRIILRTSYEGTLRITVHDILGQQLLENKVENSGDGYVYDLDMSYAASGVYLVRLGTRKVGKVKRFIVK